MKKNLTLFIAFFAMISFSNAQKYAEFSDDFESYSNNDWLALNSSVWDTWSGTPGSGGDDVQVTNGDSYSGSNSIYFNAGPGPEDVVLPFGGLYERGQFVFRSMMKIPKGKSAYFNFQGATTVGVTWSAEVSFEIDSSMTFSNTTSGTMFSSNYPQNKWFEMKVYINLSKNEWHVYIDNQYQGYFSNSINKVSYLDIYPADKDASFWMDDISFIYAPPSPNNAGVDLLSSPKNGICGKNDIRAKISNNGNNELDSVRVYWSVDGVNQSPVFVTTAIDTTNSTAGNTLEVILDSVHLLSKGLHTIKVWTAYPNGVADTINFDDTLVTTLNAEVRGVKIDYDKPFQGNKGKGTLAWPDTVCASDTLTYQVIPPTGYTNAEFGKGWKVNYVNIKNNGTAPKDTLTLKPSGSKGYRLKYMADTSEGNAIFKIEISVSIGTGCDSVLEHYFFVSPLPHVDFTANDACLGKKTQFVNTSKAGAKNKYKWDFGDNTTSSFIGSSKRYSNTGVYDVSLRAIAPSGCRATIN
ncbi:MAG: PKD domain-containing protein, partial [Bacteroidia bacterium]